MDCGLWAVGCGLWVVSCGLWVVGCGLWVVGCELWVVGCGLWVVGCGLWVVVIVLPCYDMIHNSHPLRIALPTCGRVFSMFRACARRCVHLIVL